MYLSAINMLSDLSTHQVTARVVDGAAQQPSQANISETTFLQSHARQHGLNLVRQFYCQYVNRGLTSQSDM